MITRLILLHRMLHNGQLNPGDLQALQLCKLQETLQLAWEHVPYYRHLFNESGIHPRDISGPDDLEFTRVLRQFDWIGQFRVTRLQQGKFTIAVLASDPENDAKVAHVHAALINQLGEPADIMFSFVRKLEQVGDKFLDFIIAGTESP
jgi:hypothetical protein